MSFQNFFFDKLPIYYKVNDSYKNQQGEGLLERYLKIFGVEIDNNLKPKIDSYLDNIDPFTVDPKYLTNLAYTMGSPPDLTGNNNDYARLIAYIISVYKIKGTIKAFQLLFSLLGYSVSIIEFPPDEEVYYDTSDTWDNDELWDMGCPCCSEYSLAVNTVLNTGGSCTSPNNTSISPQLLPTFTKIVEFNQPINAKLRAIIQGGIVCENVNYCYEEDITLTVIDWENYDDSELWDDSNFFDSYDIISSSTTHIACGQQTGGIGSMEIDNTFVVS